MAIKRLIELHSTTMRGYTLDSSRYRCRPTREIEIEIQRPRQGN